MNVKYESNKSVNKVYIYQPGKAIRTPQYVTRGINWMIFLHATITVHAWYPHTLCNKPRPFFSGRIKPPSTQPTACMPARPVLPALADAFTRELFSELDMMDFSQGGVVVGVSSGVVQRSWV